MTSHAAVVARSMGRPCVAGAGQTSGLQAFTRICFRASEKPRGFVFGPSVAVDHFNMFHNVSTCFNFFLVASLLKPYLCRLCFQDIWKSMRRPES